MGGWGERPIADRDGHRQYSGRQTSRAQISQLMKALVGKLLQFNHSPTGAIVG